MNANLGKLLLKCFAGALLLLACREDGVERALCLAGENRKELEKVLRYYSLDEADSLKLRAAHFLIANMPGHRTCVGHEYLSFCRKVDTMRWNPPVKELAKLVPVYSDREVVPLQDWEEDVETLDSAYLVRHIDYVFRLRDFMPWLHDLSFDDLCEYLLPYRLAGERPLDWERAAEALEAFREENLLAFDDLKHSTDRLTDGLVERMRLGLVSSLNLPGTGTYHFDCVDNAYRDLLHYRLLGIPASLDYTPFWADSDGGHYWAEPFDPAAKSHSGYWTMKRQAAKIYRKTYAAQPRTEAAAGEYVPPFFRVPYFRDVTDEYMRTSDVEVEFLKKTGTDYRYLAVFNDRAWQPVAASRSDRFERMGRNVVYLPVCYPYNRQVTAGYPFLLDADGNVCVLRPGGSDRLTLVLDRKYPYKYAKGEYNLLAAETAVVVSNDPDFRTADTVHFISGNPGMGFHCWKLHGNGRWRYFRMAPRKILEIAELEFYVNLISNLLHTHNKELNRTRMGNTQMLN